MSWTCSICKGITVNACPNCPACKSHGKISQRPNTHSDLDSYDILLEEIRTDKIYHKLDINVEQYKRIINFMETSPNRMTPEEQLFADLFNHEVSLVTNMDTLTLRAHIEELQKIAKEAKVRFYAADSEEKKRRKSSDSSKPTGFNRSVNEDKISTDAINTIKDRQKRLNKKEKIEASLIALGIDPKAAASLMSAGVIKARLSEPKEDKQSNNIKTEELTIINKSIFNPFEKKE